MHVYYLVESSLLYACLLSSLLFTCYVNLSRLGLPLDGRLFQESMTHQPISSFGLGTLSKLSLPTKTRSLGQVDQPLYGSSCADLTHVYSY